MKHPADPTISYYESHAERYAERFTAIDLTDLYSAFTRHLPEGARILDAGCGPGRDARAFSEMGYRVTAFDASPAMLDLARRQFGGPLHRLRFEDVSWTSEFDGVWAMASLLHVPRADLPGILTRLSRALVPGGAFYMSFKEGTGDRTKDERLYTDLTENELSSLVGNVDLLDSGRVWVTDDFLSKERPRWVNCIAFRRTDG